MLLHSTYTTYKHIPHGRQRMKETWPTKKSPHTHTHIHQICTRTRPHTAARAAAHCRGLIGKSILRDSQIYTKKSSHPKHPKCARCKICRARRRRRKEFIGRVPIIICVIGLLKGRPVRLRKRHNELYTRQLREARASCGLVGIMLKMYVCICSRASGRENNKGYQQFTNIEWRSRALRDISFMGDNDATTGSISGSISSEGDMSCCCCLYYMFQVLRSELNLSRSLMFPCSCSCNMLARAFACTSTNIHTDDDATYTLALQVYCAYKTHVVAVRL